MVYYPQRPAPLPVRRIEELGINPAARNTWPADIPAVREVLDHGLDLPQLTVLVGENGSGKSTLVEAIAEAYGLNPEGGTHHSMHHTQRTESGLAENMKLIREGGAPKNGVFLRAETMHGHLAYLDDISLDSGRPGRPDQFNFQSHGESFVEFVTGRAGMRGLWVFDEAESALSFNGCLLLLAQIADLLERGSQVIMATHSPLLASAPGAMILELDETGLHRRDYDDLALVQNWRRFLGDPDSYLRHLS
ncbi:AAA family ATPase [Corynebacterium sp. AOP40-9SA-29]|uniref:AAA family ATPase n=1 Tax=Corynebacterium sp. AOP40-9SA-29 TaxID=3457677 RepID=UPI0040334CBD